MIAQLTGPIVKHAKDFVVLDISGVGYKVYTTPQTIEYLRDIKEDITLLTHLSVRETALDLFGFLESAELSFFELLIAISGIGPKSALSILSLADVETLQKAVASGDTTYLTKVSGIGKKSAERIVIELKDKLSTAEYGEEGLQDEADTIDALTTLGYSIKEVREALKHIPDNTKGAGDKLKEALKILGK